MFDSETLNQLKDKRKEGQQKRRQHRDSKGAGKGHTSKQADRGIERVEERERGMKPGETRAKNRKSVKNLKLSLRGSVEIQAQHWSDRLHKPRTGSVWTDRLGWICA